MTNSYVAAMGRKCEALLQLRTACGAAQHPASYKFVALQNAGKPNNLKATHLCCDIFKEIGV
jgi:hypothetical protein